MPKKGIISTYKHGVDLVVEWQIDDFFDFSEWCFSCYWSPEFSFDDDRWWLRIWPYGWRRDRSVSFGTMDLCKNDVSSGSPRQSFSLSIKTAKGERHKEEHYTKDFDFKNWFHEFDGFISRSELTRRKSELVPDGVLTIVCTLKGSTSAGNDSNSAHAEISTPDSDSAGCSSGSGECRHCRGNFAAGILSSHQKKCEQRPIKCPDCLEVFVLQKFLNEHECRHERPEGNPGSAEIRSSDSDSDKSSSDSEAVECCHKCQNCLAIFRKQKKLLEELESQKERFQGAQSLCEDYKKVLLDGRHHDLILKVGDKELGAHRDILRARSKVFESMLDHDMKEKNTGVIDVPDCEPGAMELFLSYVYCGKIEELDHSNMLGLYYVADKYEMMELKTECSDFIKKSLSLTNICSVIQLALNHSDSDLLDCATGYFVDNVLDILPTVEWQSFHKDNFTVGNELFIKSVKKLKNA